LEKFGESKRLLANPCAPLAGREGATLLELLLPNVAEIRA
jgi:hypothetical protein